MVTKLQTENPDKENISSEEHDVKQVFTKLSKENLERIINYDVKLFSNYGSHDKMTDARRQEKIAHYKKEIEKLNNDIALKECEIEKGTAEHTEPISEELIENLITKLNQVKTCFTDNFTDITGFVQETESHDADFNKHIEQCSKDLKNIVEVIFVHLDICTFICFIMCELCARCWKRRLVWIKLSVKVDYRIHNPLSAATIIHSTF